jgi:hypothetical protein
LNAHNHYSEALSQRRSAEAALGRRERTISLARLVAFALFVAVVFWQPLLSLLPLIAFIVLIVMHDRVVRARKVQRTAILFYERGLARVEGKWSGTGDAGQDLRDEHHPFAGDLDLFGRGSLFELISIAVTRSGRTRLGDWLKVPSMDAAEIRSRQEAVQELRDDVALREDLAVAQSEVAREVEAARLDQFGSAPPVAVAPWERIAALLLPAVAVVLLLLALPNLFANVAGLTHPEAIRDFGPLVDFPFWPLLVAIVLIVIFSRRLTPRFDHAVNAVERAEPALALLAGVLARLERERFTAPRLQSLVNRLQGSDAPASVEIEKLRKLVALLEARRNQFFIPIGGLLMWTANIAMRIERWRARSGHRIGDWMEAVGEIEALASLASFAFEHPSFAMPEIVTEGPLFDARDLGHPLIPDDRRVTNDLRIGDELRLLVVSGSNMSGKSTMMRSVGLGAVLAMAGGPVCASSMRISPTAVGASIRVNDSLQEGASRFYAEILRIRQILGMAASGEPLLFLLDEVLAGTNSHDRRIGAEAIVRGLVDRGAVGLVSTHDLALAKIADDLGTRGSNVHFDDHLEGDRVVFDYRMRPGVVTRSNALALMRSVGIEV